MNNTHVTPGARATAHLDAVKAARAELDALYATENADGRKVAALHDVMRLGIQIAKVEATLEQASATWAVAEATENMKELQNLLSAKVAECEALSALLLTLRDDETPAEPITIPSGAFVTFADHAAATASPHDVARRIAEATARGARS